MLKMPYPNNFKRTYISRCRHIFRCGKSWQSSSFSIPLAPIRPASQGLLSSFICLARARKKTCAHSVPRFSLSAPAAQPETRDTAPPPSCLWARVNNLKREARRQRIQEINQICFHPRTRPSPPPLLTPPLLLPLQEGPPPPPPFPPPLPTATGMSVWRGVMSLYWGQSWAWTQKMQLAHPVWRLYWNLQVKGLLNCFHTQNY